MMADSATTGRPMGAYLEYTLLRPDATLAQIEALCREAADLGMLAVCVSPCWLGHASRILAATGVKLDTTCGFPLGSESTSVKVAQAVTAIGLGADEVDMVMNIGAFKSGLHDWVREDIAAVVAACHSRNTPLKVILETGYLNDIEKETACRLAVSAGADFVKTSTGFGPGGATVADVELLRRVAPGSVGVKAAGGIRDLKTALAMIRAGATRIGTSAGAAIVREATEAGNLV
ncbi:MAG: deoxyribose-phosphate aldolase [Anaerolineae bacterium]